MNLVKSAKNEQYIRNLADLFSNCSIDDTVTYSQMRRVIGGDPQTKRYLITAAIKLANKENGCLFTAVKGVGYLRYRDGVSAGANALHKARRAVKRGKSTMRNWMDNVNLDEAGMRRFYAMDQQLGIVEYATSRRAAPDLSKADLTVYKPKDHTRETIQALQAHREKNAG